MSTMMSHTCIILITAEYLNAFFFSVFLFVCALQVLKALFYAIFRKLCWKIELSGLFCATLYVCMYVIFIRCDRHTSNNKHKKQSQNDIQYKAAKPKTSSLTKLYVSSQRNF